MPLIATVIQEYFFVHCFQTETAVCPMAWFDKKNRVFILREELVSRYGGLLDEAQIEKEGLIPADPIYEKDLICDYFVATGRAHLLEKFANLKIEDFRSDVMWYADDHGYDWELVEYISDKTLDHVQKWAIRNHIPNLVREFVPISLSAEWRKELTGRQMIRLFEFQKKCAQEDEERFKKLLQEEQE